MVGGQRAAVVQRPPGAYVDQPRVRVGRQGGGAHPQEHLAPHVQGQGLAAGEGDESIPGGGAGVPASGTRLLLIGGDLVGEILGQLRLPLGGLGLHLADHAGQGGLLQIAQGDQGVALVPVGGQGGPGTQQGEGQGGGDDPSVFLHSMYSFARAGPRPGFLM